MPRRRPFQKGERYHVYNRWRKKQRLFHQDRDYQRMLQTMLLFKNKYKGFRILAYSFLPNHFHLVVKISKTNLELSSFIERRCASYASHFVRKHPHEKGTRVFENNFCARQVFLKYFTELGWINVINVCCVAPGWPGCWQSLVCTRLDGPSRRQTKSRVDPARASIREYVR